MIYAPVWFWLTLLLVALPAAAQDSRYCASAPARASDGKIERSRAEIAKFKAAHACPSTGKHRGGCPGWAIDHVIPLACGGCDSVTNMQWLPDVAKSASGALAKDRWERAVYCAKGKS